MYGLDWYLHVAVANLYLATYGSTDIHWWQSICWYIVEVYCVLYVCVVTFAAIC